MMALTGMGFQIEKTKTIEIENSKKETPDGNTNLDISDQNYNKIKNIDIYEMELRPHPTNVFKVWNITISIWLKRYVRDRFIFYNSLTPSKTLKNISFIATFMISAFWHGFYPSYYIIFSHFPFMIILYQNFSKINKIYKFDQKIPKIILNLIH